MFEFLKRTQEPPAVQNLMGLLVDAPATTPEEVFRRCQAAEALAALGPAACAALPALLRTLVVPVAVDCALALRVAAAVAVWKVSGCRDVALPFLAWALKDDYWGVSRRAAAVLAEMGPQAHEATPDLVALAERRLTRGPFYFEVFEQAAPDPVGATSLLAVVAVALGRCGCGYAHGREARGMLARMARSGEGDVRAAARHALEVLGTCGLEDPSDPQSPGGRG
jgi:hypothetical protein